MHFVKYLYFLLKNFSSHCLNPATLVAFGFCIKIKKLFVKLCFLNLEKKFKYCFLDVGLVKRMNQLDASVLLNQDLMLLDQGALAEQFVGQELLAHSDYYEKHQLYFWSRDEQGGRAEIDFLTVIDGQIFPIEVKSGAAGRLRSLHQYLLEHDCPFGIRLSMAPLSFEEKSGSKILSVPLYLISELPRLVKEVRETL